MKIGYKISISVALFLGAIITRTLDPSSTFLGFENTDISFMLLAFAILTPLWTLQYSYEEDFKKKLSKLDSSMINHENNYSSIVNEITKMDSISYVGNANDAALEVGEKLKLAKEVFTNKTKINNTH